MRSVAVAATSPAATVAVARADLSMMAARKPIKKVAKKPVKKVRHPWHAVCNRPYPSTSQQ